MPSTSMLVQDRPLARPHHHQEPPWHPAEPLLGGNRVRLLQDGSETLEAMFRAITEARDHVNLESCIVDDSGPGAELAGRLIERCRRGVKVNLLHDSTGCIGTSKAYFQALRQAGVTLCAYKPVPRWRLWPGQPLHRRDQRRLLVVDGRTGFMGGVNIGAEDAIGSAALHGGTPPEAASPGWRKLHLQVEGPVLQRLQRLFVSHWQHHAGGALPQARYFPPLAPAGVHRVALATSEAGRQRNPIHSALLGAIAHAHTRVLLTTACMAPPRRLVRALVQAAERGVTVELLLPGACDFWAPPHASRSHCPQLQRAGVRVHERQDGLLHAEACVVDGLWCSVGSASVDWRSVIHSAEAHLIVLDAEFAQQLESVFRGDVTRARTPDAQRSPWRRATASLASLARRFECPL